MKSFVNFTKVNPALAGAVLEKENGQYCGTQVGSSSHSPPSILQSVSNQLGEEIVESFETYGAEKPLKQISVKEGRQFTRKHSKVL